MSAKPNKAHCLDAVPRVTGHLAQSRKAQQRDLPLAWVCVLTQAEPEVARNKLHVGVRFGDEEGEVIFLSKVGNFSLSPGLAAR